jgi:3-oxoacyl-[acyl-carrier protein] reductase
MGGRNPEMFAAVKAGITGFTRALARSLAPEVRVNELAPGWIETSYAQHQMGAEYRAGIQAATPLARLGQAHEVAAAAVFLLSDEASFISGQTLKVNGGLSS